MKDAMTTAWAWVVAVLIYGIILGALLAYFGEIVLWLQGKAKQGTNKHFRRIQ